MHRTLVPMTVAAVALLAACGGRTVPGSGNQNDAGTLHPDGGLPADASPDGAVVDPCAPMDAESVEAAPACPLEPLGWSWNGEACAEIWCVCAGQDCDALYASASDCRTARSACLPPSRCEDYSGNMACENQPGCAIVWYGGGCVNLDTCTPDAPSGDHWICWEQGIACAPTGGECNDRQPGECTGACRWVEHASELCFDDAGVQPCCWEESWGYCMGDEEPGDCAAQDVTGCSDPCTTPVGVYWDGESCQPIRCCCEGPDCGATYATADECLADHVDCSTNACTLAAGYCLYGDAVEPTCDDGWGTALGLQVDGVCGMGKCCAPCPAEDDPDVDYVAHSPEECAVIDYDCFSDGWVSWSSECGCGCRRLVATP